jgi:hypothetical protein
MLVRFGHRSATPLFALLGVWLIVAGCGQAATREEGTMADQRQHGPGALTLARITPRDPGVTVRVTSEAVGADGSIDLRHSAYGDGVSPPLGWTPVAGAGAYAIILEDPDAPGATPFVHWLIWNIPGDVSSLPEGVPNTGRPAWPQGATQARNGVGTYGYFGPRPPRGTGTHHYHFQVFALDHRLVLRGDADIRALTQAMDGHVLADGELVGTFAAPAQQ